MLGSRDWPTWHMSILQRPAMLLCTAWSCMPTHLGAQFIKARDCARPASVSHIQASPYSNLANQQHARSALPCPAACSPALNGAQAHVHLCRWIDEHCGWQAELQASSSDPRQALREYTITALTSGVRHAGSNIWSKIFVEVAGCGCDSGPQLLLSPGGQFQPGRVDTVTVQLKDLGQLEAVELWGSSHARVAPAWHLDMIVVVDGATGARSPPSLTSPHHGCMIWDVLMLTHDT